MEEKKVESTIMCRYVICRADGQFCGLPGETHNLPCDRIGCGGYVPTSIKGDINVPSK